MRRFLSHLLIALLLALAPAALAQEEEKGDPARPDDAAWVEDCPPDMACAFGDTVEDEPSRGPSDGSCDTCRGPTGELPAEGTCMDGADAGEVCDDDVQYVGGPPARTGGEPADAQPTREVPAAGVALAVAALGLAIVALARRG
ncbi:MAG TPA: hypothetical protein VM582_02820 [Candidatus Thermoplasmatota archaeon]|nr:hypothetical protein [Candidatus Thermoplasmatota archaeon]